MKYVIVILDGASGWPIDSLGGKTTLQAADTPNLDALAKTGTMGLALTVPGGAEPSSSAACTSILGYDPVADYVGRGAIEAASMGISLAADQIALRLNLVTVRDGVMASYSAGSIATEESAAIVTDISSDLNDSTFRLYPGVAYRHILVVTGHPELLGATYTPPHDISDRRIEPYLPKGPGSELLLDYMGRARVLLDNSGVNRCRTAESGFAATDVWPFWPGMAPRELIPFAEMRGLSAAMTSGVDLLNGLAVLAGMDRLSIAGVTGDSSNDYVAQTKGALHALDDHDLVVIHVEAPDEEGHAGDVEGKVAAIEAIDREVISRVRWYASEHELRVLAMPDHPTPIEIRTHIGEPVPFVLAGSGVSHNGGQRFDEDSAEETGIRLDPGRKVMDLLLSSRLELV
jgi:2,3-bisphosphoglycerate-independent phosphoglycerate mutase